MENFSQNSRLRTFVDRWPQDKILIQTGNCFFDVDYLGCVEVSEPTNSKSCRESFSKLYQEYVTGIGHKNAAVLWITGYELRVVENVTKNLILAQTIENVLFCASNTANPNQLYYTCRDAINNRWLCHLFISKNYSGDRLCRAIGYAFQECLRRCILREGYTTSNNRCLG